MKKSNLLFGFIALAFLAAGFVRSQNNNAVTEMPETVQESGKVGVNVGDIAKDIDLPNLDGTKNIKLSSLRGNYVLLDFWASWCRPCRIENPTLVKAYEKYSKAKLEGCAPGKNFTIYSVSLDRDRAAWTAAVKQDNLTWPNHVSDLKFWNTTGVAEYGITSIPANILIDPDGKIIAKNLRGGNLMLALDKHLVK